MKRLHTQGIMGWVRQHWRRVTIYGVGGIAVLLVITQLIFPYDRLPLFTRIDGQSVGGWRSVDATRVLNDRYKQQKIDLYFGSSTKAYRSPSAAAIGLTTDNTERVANAAYPLWQRFIPSSLFWAAATKQDTAPSYSHDSAKVADYVKKELGGSCDIAAQNASVAVKDETLVVVPSIDGGTCKPEDVVKGLVSVSPKLPDQHKVTIAMVTRPPQITNESAAAFASAMTQRIGSGVSVKVGNESVAIDKKQLLSWLEFTATAPSITVAVNSDKAGSFFASQVAPKVAKPAGVSKVSTLDFVETSRVDGPAGQTLNVQATLDQLANFITSKADSATAQVSPIAPKIEYSRSYSPTDTGLSALLKQYAESHPGTYGISLVELSGQHRRASFQDTKQFRTASTYKLYVAYSTLKRIESGSWKWTDQISGGRDLAKCFDDMIVKSDNPCGEALLSKIGYTTITNELKSAGLTGTSFTGSEPLTTAGDLSTFNASLESGQLLSTDSKNRLIAAMKRNIYRQGIPAGAGATVANKVGFLDGYLHDAAIIYTSSGPVVLSVMTNGSSWATIADLTKQIEQLRTR